MLAVLLLRCMIDVGSLLLLCLIHMSSLLLLRVMNVCSWLLLCCSACIDEMWYRELYGGIRSNRCSWRRPQRCASWFLFRPIA